MIKSQITLEVLAPTTPVGEKLYMAGSLNAWKVGDAKYAFTQVEPGKYRLVLDLSRGTLLEYKLNRGNWTSVEVDAKGQENDNRRLAVFGSTSVIIEIPHWRDQACVPTSTRTRKTDVRMLPKFKIAALGGRERDVVIYLPPNYELEPNRRFPVMYLFDGQNLFDPATAFNLEWKVDETCDRLIATGAIQPMIVVGIYNGGEHRLSEQSPWRDMRLNATGEGHGFMRWIASSLKSYIDTEFRTLTGAEHTGIGGSSLGGLTSLFAIYRYPLVFGRVAALSPAFWFARSQIFRYIASQPLPQGARVYLDCGEKETARVHPKRDFYKVAASMVELLKQQGFRDGEDLLWVSDPKGTHSEHHWARRLGPALEFLFPGDRRPMRLQDRVIVPDAAKR
jgi:predicted alpha/beta superfamily hydrolase